MSSNSTLDSLKEGSAICERLVRAGMSSASAEQKAAMFGQSAQALIDSGHAGDTAAFAWFVPGRIEVLGKHTDYAGGRSLTVALERGFCAVAVGRTDSQMQVIELGGHQSAEFALSPEISPASGHWTNYPMVVCRRVARNFGEEGPLEGASIAFVSDLPLASGMSSSSALVITMFLLLADINKLEEHPAYQRSIENRLDLAGYVAAIENGQGFRELVGDLGVGTFGGSEDHTAILNATAGTMSQYSYCPVRKERMLELPDGLVFAIASSGVVAEKAGAAMEKYNLASQSAAAVAEIWRSATERDDSHIAAAIASSPGAIERLRGALAQSHHAQFTPEQLLNRFDHFFAESEQIIPAINSLSTQDDLAHFGDLVQRSQQLSETLLGNQIPETIFLAKTARELGAHAASAFGAGFGGSVWALVEQDRAADFLDAWESHYCGAHALSARNATFFATIAGPAALSVA